VIPDAAVEAAADALCRAVWGTPWGVAIESQRDTFRAEAAKALEAAAPHIAAKALEDAADAFENLPANKGASISSGTWDWFELFPVQHIRDRAEGLRK